MGGKSDCVEYTTGYRYYLGVHMIACHGPVDAVMGMKTDDYEVVERQSF